MKILCIANVYQLLSDYIYGRSEPKGAPGFYKFLIGAEARGHEVHVIFRTNENINNQLSSNIYAYPGKVNNRLLLRFPSKFLLDVYGAVVQGLHLHKQHHFDVIYGQQSYGAAAGYLLSKIIHVPNATRLYGSALYGQFGTNLFRMFTKNYKSTLPFILPSHFLLITQDGTQVDRVAPLLGVKENRLKVWFNGIDPSFLTTCDEIKVDWPVPEGGKSLLWLGRLQGWKRPERALEAFYQLHLTREDIHLLYVGSGDAVPNLKSRVNDLKLNSHVHFIDSVSHSQVKNYYRKCDIFLSLFDFSNLSNTVIEAMASGTSVLALNTGDTSLLIKNGETGFLVEPEDLDKLPTIISQLIDNEKLRKQVGENAQYYIKTNFSSWEERIAKEVKLLEEIK